MSGQMPTLEHYISIIVNSIEWWTHNSCKNNPCLIKPFYGTNHGDDIYLTVLDYFDCFLRSMDMPHCIHMNPCNQFLRQAMELCSYQWIRFCICLHPCRYRSICGDQFGPDLLEWPSISPKQDLLQAGSENMFGNATTQRLNWINMWWPGEPEAVTALGK